MNWYFSAIELVAYFFIFIMARHLYYRSRFFIHILQQSGYKASEFGRWIKDHWSTHFITVEHAAFNLLILLSLWYLSEYFTHTVIVLLISIFGVIWFGSVSKWNSDQQKKPLVYTPRVQRLTAVFTFVAVFIPAVGTITAIRTGIHFPDIHILAFTWIISDLLIPVFIFPVLFLLWPVEKIIQNGFIKQARKKIASLPNLKIIGITGSYGKTSTKFIIQHILKERFSVCFTPGSYNTPMGICKVINNDLQSSHQILILEMGARYKGNIDELCRIAAPDVAVLTNVGIAHLETFGSKQKIAETKAEILNHVPKDGAAILNADDPLVVTMPVPEGATKITAGIGEADFTASDIQYGPEGCTFTVTSPDKSSAKISTKLLGAHNVLNILLGFSVGHYFGMRLTTMAMAAQTLEPVEHRLELKNRNGITVIDDAFNSNPIGARNAIEVLGKFNSGQRIIITPGIIELGEKEDEENVKLGFAIKHANLDHVFLVGKQQTAPIYRGLLQSGFDMKKVEVVNSLFEANDKAKAILKPGDTVLYENDLPDSYNE